ncbi:putative kinesin [Trichoderma chlorosporum]
MRRSFPNISFSLMVGIGGGAPGPPSNDSRNDIRLGDVVVSCPTVDSGGVLQYDFGKTVRDGKFIQTGTLNKTCTQLRTGISALRARHQMTESEVPLYIAAMLQSKEKMRKKFSHPGLEHDELFRADYDHAEDESSCGNCDRGALLLRVPRADKNPVIHYGLIGSANQVMKHGLTREKLRLEKGITCFEMEAAGLMDSLPCLVVRGICDYADSHKNKMWQPYAATTAAAYAKEILSVIPAAEVASTSYMNTTYRALRSCIPELSLEQMIQFLPTIGQSQYISKLRNVDPADPKFAWVFKNSDYKCWRSKNTSLILSLSTPTGHYLSPVSSYIVRQEEQAKLPVLYCFCSYLSDDLLEKRLYTNVINMTLVNVVIYTLLEQVLCISPPEKSALIMRYFINIQLQETFKEQQILDWMVHGSDNESILQNFRSLLGKTATKDLLNTFQIAVEYLKPPPFMIVLDRVDKLNQINNMFHLVTLINNLHQQNSGVKVLLVGPETSQISGLPGGSLCIEFDKERQECISSLYFDNTRYEKISAEHSGSFEWIWTHKEYKSWSASEISGLLYIQGKPGSGKSTLTKYFDFHLLSRDSTAKQAIVAKFFYSYREGELQRSHYNMLLSILYDILNQEEAFFYHKFQTEYRIHRRFKMKWDYASLKRILSSLQDYTLAKRLYLVIDAVDESEQEDRRDILTLLYDLCSKAKTCDVKIFIASRPVQQLEILNGQYISFIKLQDETTSDISNFTHALLHGLNLEQVIKYILDHAQGVFLWVKLVGEELLILHENGDSERDIFKRLVQLPTELEELYILMLNKMRENKSYIAYGLKMFRFVLFARRPLTVNELLHSLGIPDDTESDLVFFSDDSFEERIPSSERIIISSGGNFIEIKQRTDGQRVVQVIHQTALEFLCDPFGVVASSEYRIEREHAHFCIALTCMRYLRICAINTSRLEGPPFSDRWLPEHYEYYAQYLEKRPLASYASCYLRDHINSCREYVQDNSGIQHLAAQLSIEWINDPFNFLLDSWIDLNGAMVNSKAISKKLLFTSVMGELNIAAETLIAVGIDINIADAFGRTPLSWAAGNGQEAAVKFLLRNHANYAQDNAGKTPFSWAAGNGHEGVVKLLLEYGADYEAKDLTKRTPLSWAAGNGHESAVELLLQHCADYKTRDVTELTPLLWAARNGHEGVVKLLLQHGADYEARDLTKRTPLLWAADNGHESAAQLLLQHGADYKTRDVTEQTPFSWAAGNGHEGVVKLLLEYGADYEAKDSIMRTPLSWAAGNGHESVVKLLLQHGANYKAKDLIERTPLLWAVGNGHKGVVRLLL